MSLILSAIVEYVEENHKSWRMHVYRKEEVIRLYNINDTHLWPIVVNCNEQFISVGSVVWKYYTEQSILQKIDELINQCEQRAD